MRSSGVKSRLRATCCVMVEAPETTSPPLQVLPDGADDGPQIEAGMLVVQLVLGGQRGGHQVGRDAIERHVGPAAGVRDRGSRTAGCRHGRGCGWSRTGRHGCSGHRPTVRWKPGCSTGTGRTTRRRSAAPAARTGPGSACGRRSRRSRRTSRGVRGVLRRGWHRAEGCKLPGRRASPDRSRSGTRCGSGMPSRS